VNVKIQVVKRQEIILAGPVAVTPEADSKVISTLWDRYDELAPKILHKGTDIGYELHISEAGRHHCLAGIEVAKLEKLPLGCFATTIPAGEYAVFTHKFSQGNYSDAYRQIKQWLRINAPTGAEASNHFEIQVYDHRFKGMSNPETEIDFLIPLF